MPKVRTTLPIDFADLRARLIHLPRLYKRVALVVHDLALLSLAMWLAMSVRMNTFYVPETPELFLMFAVAPIIGVGSFLWFGLYRLVTRYLGSHGIGRLLACLALSVLLWSLAILTTGVGLPANGFGTIPRSMPLAYFIVGAAFLVGSRSAAAWFLHGVEIKVTRNWRRDRAILIYGAGTPGVQLLEMFSRTREARVAGFLDSAPNLWGQYVAGVKVYRPEKAKITRLIERESVTEVILALPHLKRREQQAILRSLQAFPVKVQLLPSIADLASGRVTTTDIRPVLVEDLLGRDPVPPNPQLLAEAIRDKSVLVTGAGGSIGSELVRQIFKQRPRRLVLLEQSEPALYDIETEIEDLMLGLPAGAERPTIVGVLGSVLDREVVDRTIRNNQVQTIYHAAAYKHVPIVEENPVAGITNNVFGTRTVADAARSLGVERFVLVSTDKAVRPTNVMGASKRVSELVLQAYAADPTCETVFTMVRFGNVLDSSGSVVRRFRRQIAEGGPITVTHPDVTRYFMSIPEAAELVLQAGAMADGGDVFLLEMGEPVKIDDLARSMVRLAGLELRDADNPDGEIEIVYTGLRAGEKLYEELLIDDAATATDHPRIMKHNEPFLPHGQLAAELDVLQGAMADNDRLAIEAVLMRVVEGYRPPSPVAQSPRAIEVSPVGSRMVH